MADKLRFDILNETIDNNKQGSKCNVERKPEVQRGCFQKAQAFQFSSADKTFHIITKFCL